MTVTKPTSWQPLIKNILDNSKQALQLGLWGALGGAVGSIFGDIILYGRDIRQANLMTLVIQVGFWFAVIGLTIAFTLLLGNSWYLKRGLKWQESLKSAILPGLVSGLIAGAIAQAMFTLLGSTELLRVICWGIAGGLLGLGLSFRIPNLGKWRGLGGGFIGGLIGGCLFIAFSFLIGEVIGRILGLAAIGFFIGLMIILIESAFREAWLIVHYSPNEQKTVTLGSQPVILGSSNKAHIYLPKSQGYPPITAKIYLENKQIWIQFDENYGQKMKQLSQKLNNGDKRKLGNVTLEIKTIAVLNDL
jgi:Ca-activated chloride channel family protein